MPWEIELLVKLSNSRACVAALEVNPVITKFAATMFACSEEIATDCVAALEINVVTFDDRPLIDVACADALATNDDNNVDCVPALAYKELISSVCVAAFACKLAIAKFAAAMLEFKADKLMVAIAALVALTFARNELISVVCDDALLLANI